MKCTICGKSICQCQWGNINEALQRTEAGGMSESDIEALQNTSMPAGHEHLNAELEAAPQPPASAVDVEALKDEAMIFIKDKIVSGEADHPQAVKQFLDHLHQRGYFGLTVDKESGE